MVRKQIVGIFRVETLVVLFANIKGVMHFIIFLAGVAKDTNKTDKQIKKYDEENNETDFFI